MEPVGYGDVRPCTLNVAAGARSTSVAPTRADGQIEAKLSEVEQAMGSMNRDMNQRMARLEQMLSQVTGS